MSCTPVSNHQGNWWQKKEKIVWNVHTIVFCPYLTNTIVTTPPALHNSWFGTVICYAAGCMNPNPPIRGFIEGFDSAEENATLTYRCSPDLVPRVQMSSVCTNMSWTPDPSTLECREPLPGWLGIDFSKLIKSHSPLSPSLSHTHTHTHAHTRTHRHTHTHTHTHNTTHTHTHTHWKIIYTFNRLGNKLNWERFGRERLCHKARL